MKIAIAGSSGLIGTELVEQLNRAGHSITRLTRDANDKDPNSLYWDPAESLGDLSALDGIDAVVNLCGEGIASKRWSEEQKKKIWNSRIQSTRFLVESLAKLNDKPKVFVSASAIGFYGSFTGREAIEDSQKGTGFCSELCDAWEHEGLKAKSLGIRVVTPRIGIVLSKNGGALAKMLPPFKLGLGGPLGTGDQYMSWISLTDVCRALVFTIEEQSVEGAINLTAPNPATNRKFSTALAKFLGRPCFFKVPGFVIKIALGQMGQELLLEGSKVLPKKLLEHGFKFNHKNLEDSFRDELASA